MLFPFAPRFNRLGDRIALYPLSPRNTLPGHRALAARYHLASRARLDVRLAFSTPGRTLPGLSISP